MFSRIPSRAALFCLIATVAASGLGSLHPATAENTPANDRETENELQWALDEAGQDKPTVVVLQPFDHPITLYEAIQIAQRGSYGATSVRIENPGISAEYSLVDSLTADDFAKWFEGLYGTDPQAAGLQVRVDAVETRVVVSTEAEKERVVTLYKPAAQPEMITTGLETFVAPSPLGGEAYDYFVAPESSTAAASTDLLLSPPNGLPLPRAVPTSVSWAPNYMELRVERVHNGVENRQYFFQFASWRNGADPDVRPQQNVCVQANCKTVDWGMEFNIDLFNYGLAPGLKPACQVNNEINFLAVNEGYSWGVTQGQSSVALTTNAYKDDWEIADDCRKNSFAVGLAMPWNIPQNSNGFEQVLVSINAPVGLRTNSNISGTVTLNDNFFCNPGIALTNCMGDLLLPPPAPYEAGRLTLREGRGWIAAPNKCWISPNSGLPGSDPALSIPFDQDGCF